MSPSVKREILPWSYKSRPGRAQVTLSSYEVKLEVSKICECRKFNNDTSNDQIVVDK